MTLHNTLCRHLGECSYPPRREVQLFLLHSRQRGALLAPVNATLARCVTGWPPVYRDDARLERKVSLRSGSNSSLSRFPMQHMHVCQQAVFLPCLPLRRCACLPAVPRCRRCF